MFQCYSVPLLICSIVVMLIGSIVVMLICSIIYMFKSSNVTVLINKCLIVDRLIVLFTDELTFLIRYNYDLINLNIYYI